MSGDAARGLVPAGVGGVRGVRGEPNAARALRAWQAPATVVAALDLGVLGDVLMRAPGPPALNFLLWTLALAATVTVIARRREPLSREATLLLSAAVFFAAAMVWRDSPALKLLDFACVATMMALLAFRRGEAWVRAAGVARYLWALVASGLSGAFGAFGLVADVDWRRELADMPGVAWRRRALALLRGLAISLPILAVFAMLLSGADAVFSHLLARTFRFDLGVVVSHIVLTGFVAWVTSGYLRQLWAGEPTGVVPTMGGGVRPRLGIVEVGIPLGLLNLLFAAFVVVQVRYFFGGAASVQATAGLTYAEYARQGFFELVVVAALVLPLLLATDALLERRGPGDEWIFRSLALAQLALVFVIMASALQRMRLYQATYGLTELRLYTTAFMCWIAGLSGWLAATVLAGRRRRFAFGALVSGAAAVVALNALDPDALIARVNADRAARGERYDPAYLAVLSGDAVPTLVRRLPALPAPQRCQTARSLGRWWRHRRPQDWRAWNLGSARARAAMGELLRNDIGDPTCVWKTPSRSTSTSEEQGATRTSDEERATRTSDEHEHVNGQPRETAGTSPSR